MGRVEQGGLWVDMVERVGLRVERGGGWLVVREGWWVAKEGWLVARAGWWLDMVELKLKGEQRTGKVGRWLELQH